jgi:hypothetical protein
LDTPRSEPSREEPNPRQLPVEFPALRATKFDEAAELRAALEPPNECHWPSLIAGRMLDDRPPDMLELRPDSIAPPREAFPGPEERGPP